MQHGEKMSEIQVNSLNSQEKKGNEKVTFKKVIHLDFLSSNFVETFKPRYYLYEVKWTGDIYEVFVAVSKRGRIAVLYNDNGVGVALMRTQSNNIAVDVFYKELPGGEVVEDVLFDIRDVKNDQDPVVVEYDRNGKIDEFVIPKRAFTILQRLLYYPRLVAGLDAVINYTI